MATCAGVGEGWAWGWVRPAKQRRRHRQPRAQHRTVGDLGPVGAGGGPGRDGAALGARPSRGPRRRLAVCPKRFAVGVSPLECAGNVAVVAGFTFGPNDGSSEGECAMLQEVH